MTEKPLVSIIIPCYNVENYVEECINSLLKQDYENWECIAINDGSKDATLDVLKRIEANNNKIKVLTKQNSGPSDTRNMGIELAKGEFIYFLDSDDAITPDAIGTLVSSFENNDIIVGKTKASTFSETPITKDHLSMVIHPKEGNITFQNQDHGILIRTMESGLTPIPHNKLYRTDFIISNNNFEMPIILMNHRIQTPPQGLLCIVARDNNADQGMGTVNHSMGYILIWGGKNFFPKRE